MSTTSTVAELKQLQHINVKLLLANPDGVDLEPLIPIFHEWIQEQKFEGLLLDIADYRHVDGGPGIALIGHEGNYSVDNTDHRLGVRYNRKASLAGSNQDRLKQAARAALVACQSLEADPRLNGKLHFDGREIEIFVNDRLLAPNAPETQKIFGPDFQEFAKRLVGSGNFSLSYDSDPRKLFSVTVKVSQPLPVARLLQTLG